MRNRIGLCLMMFVVIITASACSSPVTEESIKNLLTKADKAANTKDISMISSLLADDIDITLQVDVNGQAQTMEMSKKQYIELANQSKSMIENYKYKRKDTRINLQGSKAKVSFYAEESMTIMGQDMYTEVKNNLVIEMIDGKPMITEIFAFNIL